jgi:GntR family transcriptional regulator
MLWRIDLTSDEPLFLQLAAQVHVALATGDLRPGDRLPAARDLAESLSLNVHTVLHAYQTLRDEGVIELRRGRGAVVADSVPHAEDRVQRTLEAFAREAAAAGLSPEAASTLLREAMAMPDAPSARHINSAETEGSSA